MNTRPPARDNPAYVDVDVDDFPYYPSDSGNTDIRNTVNSVAKAEITDRASSIVAVLIACASMFWTWRLSVDYRQVQIQLMYANAIMIREGLVQPGDEVYGPEGNLEYKQHEFKRKEK